MEVFLIRMNAGELLCLHFEAFLSSGEVSTRACIVLVASCAFFECGECFEFQFTSCNRVKLRIT